MTKKLPTVDIKGKEYVQVKDRVLYLAEEIKDYSIETAYDYFPERKLWVVKAKLILKKDGKENTYTGLAQEIESDDYKDVNHTSALENAETSAVGRACAMAGIGVLDSIASVDEMRKSENRVSIQKQAYSNNSPANIIPPENLKPCDKCGGEFTLKNGSRGSFYGCSGYKNGCRRTLDMAAAEMWIATDIGNTERAAKTANTFDDGSPLPDEPPF